MVRNISSIITSPFSNFEVHGCIEEDGHIHQCDNGETPQFWSVYVRYIPIPSNDHFGGLSCIADCDTNEEANDLCALFEAIYQQWTPDQSAKGNSKLVNHILAMKGDAYLDGHPEWHEIVKDAEVIGWQQIPFEHSDYVHSRFKLPFMSMFEGQKETLYTGVYIPCDHWNGWCIPYFTKEVAMQIAIDCDLLVDYNEDRNMIFTCSKESGDEKQYEGILIDGVMMFGIGAYEWCWVSEGINTEPENKEYVSWNYAKTQAHDISGVDHPDRYKYWRRDGIYYPAFSSYTEPQKIVRERDTYNPEGI